MSEMSDYPGNEQTKMSETLSDSFSLAGNAVQSLCSSPDCFNCSHGYDQHLDPNCRIKASKQGTIKKGL